MADGTPPACSFFLFSCGDSLCKHDHLVEDLWHNLAKNSAVCLFVVSSLIPLVEFLLLKLLFFSRLSRKKHTKNIPGTAYCFFSSVQFKLHVLHWTRRDFHLLQIQVQMHHTYPLAFDFKIEKSRNVYRVSGTSYVTRQHYTSGQDISGHWLPFKNTQHFFAVKLLY